MQQITEPKFTISDYVIKSKNITNPCVFMYNYIKETYSNVHISNQYSNTFFSIDPTVDNFQIDFHGARYAPAYGAKINGGVVTGQWVMVPMNHAWSLINKGNAIYTNEEWESIVTWSISGDKESRNLALSMLKNADHTDIRLVSMCLSLLFKADAGIVDTELFNVICGIHNEKNYKNRDNNLDMMLCYVCSVPAHRRGLFNNPNIVDIFTRKYKGFLSIGEIKVK
jgi:hypothetical protein